MANVIQTELKITFCLTTLVLIKIYNLISTQH